MVIEYSKQRFILTVLLILYPEKSNRTMYAENYFLTLILFTCILNEFQKAIKQCTEEKIMLFKINIYQVILQSSH